MKHHLWPRYAELEPLAAHGLDQDRKLQFAAPGDDIGVRSRRILDAQGDIALGLLVKSVADDAARHLVAFGSGERRIIDQERHRQGRRIDRLRLQRLDDVGRAERVGDVEFLEPGDGDDIARLRLIDRRALDASEGEDLRYTPLFDDIALAVQDLDALIGFDAAREHPPGDEPAEIGVGFEQRAEHAKPAFARFGGGTCFNTRSNKGPMPSFGPSGLSAIQPCLADP